MSPVRILREAVGQTQAAFAASLGVTAKYLQKLELGEDKRRVSVDLADKMFAAFGVTRSSILKARGRPRHHFESPGFPDLITNIQSWQKFIGVFESSAEPQFHAYFVPKLEVLFAAAQRKHAAKFCFPKRMVLALQLDRWIDDVAKKFDLSDSIDRILHEREEAGSPVQWISASKISSRQETISLPDTTKVSVTFRVSAGGSSAANRSRTEGRRKRPARREVKPRA